MNQVVKFLYIGMLTPNRPFSLVQSGGRSPHINIMLGAHAYKSGFIVVGSLEHLYLRRDIPENSSPIKIIHNAIKKCI